MELTKNLISKSSLKNPRADFDGFWKQLIETYFQPFIEMFYPQAAKDIDWSRGFTFLDKELQKITRGAKAGKYIVDKLVKVYRKNGQEQWVLLHIELQCQHEDGFEQRFYFYHCRIIDGFQIPVASLAILADDNPNWRPNEYWHELWGCKAGISFPMVKLLDYKDKQEELEKHPLGILILAYLQALETQKDSQARYDRKLQLTRSLYQRGLSKETILDLYHLIDWVLSLPMQLEVKYTDEIVQLEKELNMQHITSAERVGIQKGIQQEKLEVAKKLLNKGSDINTIKEITSLPRNKIEELQRQTHIKG